jgi:hypothetical protein
MHKGVADAAAGAADAVPERSATDKDGSVSIAKGSYLRSRELLMEHRGRVYGACAVVSVILAYYLLALILMVATVGKAIEDVQLHSFDVSDNCFGIHILADFTVQSGCITGMMLGSVTIALHSEGKLFASFETAALEIGAGETRISGHSFHVSIRDETVAAKIVNTATNSSMADMALTATINTWIGCRWLLPNKASVKLSTSMLVAGGAWEYQGYNNTDGDEGDKGMFGDIDMFVLSVNSSSTAHRSQLHTQLEVVQGGGGANSTGPLGALATLSMQPLSLSLRCIAGEIFTFTFAFAKEGPADSVLLDVWLVVDKQVLSIHTVYG